MDVKDKSKKIYQEPEIELCFFDRDDVIVCSGEDILDYNRKDTEGDWDNE